MVNPIQILQNVQYRISKCQVYEIKKQQVRYTGTWQPLCRLRSGCFIGLDAITKAARQKLHDKAVEMLTMWLQLEEKVYIDSDDESENCEELDGSKCPVDKVQLQTKPSCCWIGYIIWVLS